MDLSCPQQAHVLNARFPDFGATWKAVEPFEGGDKLLGVEQGRGRRALRSLLLLVLTGCLRHVGSQRLTFPPP